MDTTPNPTFTILLPDQEWQRLQDLLDAPPRDTPKLAALLAEPSLFPSTIV